MKTVYILSLAVLAAMPLAAVAAPAVVVAPCRAGPAEGFPETDEEFEALCEGEKSAYAKALYNFLRARCLRRVVDYKFDYDEAFGNGQILDFGSPLKPGLCDNPADLLQ